MKSIDDSLADVAHIRRNGRRIEAMVRGEWHSISWVAARSLTSFNTIYRRIVNGDRGEALMRPAHADDHGERTRNGVLMRKVAMGLAVEVDPEVGSEDFDEEWPEIGV